MSLTLLWLDLETTGLRPRKDHVLEVSLAIASMDNPFLARHAFHSVVWYPQECWHEIDPYARDVHTKSGLLEECASPLAPSVEAVEDSLLAYVVESQSRDARPVLAGSSVHFDHAFLERHMPRVAERLSHRHYDVSALKLYCESMGMPQIPKAKAHRANDDVKESIEHGMMCTRWLIVNAARMCDGD